MRVTPLSERSLDYFGGCWAVLSCATQDELNDIYEWCKAEKYAQMNTAATSVADYIRHKRKNLILVVGVLRKLRGNPANAQTKVGYETLLAKDKFLRQEYADYLGFLMTRRPGLTQNGISLEELNLYREGTLIGNTVIGKILGKQ